MLLNPRKAPTPRQQAEALARYYADRDGRAWFVVRRPHGKAGETVSVERPAPKKTEAILQIIKVEPGQ